MVDLTNAHFPGSPFLPPFFLERKQLIASQKQGFWQLRMLPEKSPKLPARGKVLR
jgi:hypothetical protein